MSGLFFYKSTVSLTVVQLHSIMLPSKRKVSALSRTVSTVSALAREEDEEKFDELELDDEDTTEVDEPTAEDKENIDPGTTTPSELVNPIPVIPPTLSMVSKIMQQHWKRYIDSDTNKYAKKMMEKLTNTMTTSRSTFAMIATILHQAEFQRMKGENCLKIKTQDIVNNNGMISPKHVDADKVIATLVLNGYAYAHDYADAFSCFTPTYTSEECHMLSFGYIAWGDGKRRLQQLSHLGFTFVPTCGGDVKWEDKIADDARFPTDDSIVVDGVTVPDEGKMQALADYYTSSHTWHQVGSDALFSGLE